MPKVNPDILVWARESAGLTLGEAASKLGFRDTKHASAEAKLIALERGERDPSRPQLAKMSRQYRRPLLSFYLSKRPKKGDRGVDFRSQSGDRSPEDEAVVDALVRNVQARQSMVREILQALEEDEPLAFVGSHSLEQDRDAVRISLARLLDVSLEMYRTQRNANDAFNLLRASVERAGVFVVIKGDLGNYRSAIDVDLFRGFSIADDIAPFIVINDQDARPAWSFTLLHEMVHLFLGQTGMGSSRADSHVERFCDEVASEFLLPTAEIETLAMDSDAGIAEVSRCISSFADERNLSRTMVAYRAHRCSLIDGDVYGRLATAFRQQWRTDRERFRQGARDREGGPNYYVIRRHRLGNRITGLVHRALNAGELTTSKAAKVLDLKPGQVGSMIDGV